MKSAPPTVPGMPSANSSPESPRDTAARASLPMCAAAPAVTPLVVQATRRNPAPSLTTTPRMPPSPTRRFDPAPTTVTGSRCAAAARTTAASSSADAGCASTSAGPPIRNDVWRASGSRHRTRVPSVVTSASYVAAASSPIVRRSVQLAGRSPAPQEGEQFVGGAMDVAGAERHHEIALLHDVEQGLGQRNPLGNVADVQVPPLLERLVEGVAGDALQAILAGSVDVRQQHHRGVVEGREELLKEITRPRVAVGLERHDEAAVEPGARRTERGADLLGVMPVVVDEQHALLVAAHLEAPVHAAELFQRVGDDAPRDVELVGHRERGERVEGVVRARDLQAHGAELLIAPP